MDGQIRFEHATTVEIFESPKKNLRIQKCPDTGGRHPKDSKISIPRCNFVPFHVALSIFKYP